MKRFSEWSHETLDKKLLEKCRDIVAGIELTDDKIKEHGYVLTPGRYVGAAEVEDDGIPFEEKMAELSLKRHYSRSIFMYDNLR